MIAQVIVNKKLKNEVLDYEIPNGLSVENYSLVKVPFRKDKILGVVLAKKSTSAFRAKPIEKVLTNGPLFTSTQLKLAQILKRDALSSLNETLFAFLPSLNIRDLKKMGSPSKPVIYKTKEPIFYLATWQQRLEYFCQKGLLSNKQVLLVLPTIEKIEKAQKIINDISSKSSVFCWHSKIKKIEKAQIWQNILEGKPCTIIGSRHSLFLPFINLEYIFLDDPTNFAYHDDQAPYYNALSIAKKIMQISKCNLVIMSAICDLQSFANIKNNKLKLIENKSGTKIFIKESFSMLLKSPGFEKYLTQKISAKKRVLILGRFQAGQRAFCQNCQKELFCPLCESDRLTLVDNVCSSCHKNPGVLTCPNCSGTKIKLLGRLIEDEKTRLASNYPFLKNIIGLGNSNCQVVICDIKDFNSLKPAFDTVVFVDFNRLANTPYIDFRYKLFQLVLNTSDLYARQIIICNENSEGSDFINQIKNANWKGFLNKQLRERKKLSLPPFERSLRIKFKTKPGPKKEGVFLNFVKSLKNFKAISGIEVVKKSDFVRLTVLGTVPHQKWSNFICDFQKKAITQYHIEPDPVELS